MDFAQLGYMYKWVEESKLGKIETAFVVQIVITRILVNAHLSMIGSHYFQRHFR